MSVASYHKVFSLYFAAVKQWIAYICITIFSLQILPVKEIGKILFKGQITEEEVHGYAHTDDDDCPKLKKDGEPPYLFHDHSQENAHTFFLSREVNTAIHKSEHLPSNFIPDILTPPPNC